MSDYGIPYETVLPAAEFDALLAWLDEEDDEPIPELVELFRRARERGQCR